MAAVAKIPVLINGLMAQARPKFAVFMRYAKVELAPPTPADIPQIKAGLGRLLTSAKTGKWKELTVKEASLNSLVAAEIIFWFYIGECIGKRHLVGYNI